MADTAVTVTLSVPGGESSSGDGMLSPIPRRMRVGRAVAWFVGALGVAVLFLPIPIIHLLAPPAIVVTGIVLAVRQFRVTARLTPLRLACPKCGAMIRLGGGIGLRDPAQPLAVRCEDCRRGLIALISWFE